MLTQFMGASQAAEYLNVSLTWVPPVRGSYLTNYGGGRDAKPQFKISEVQAWARQRRLG
jgi:hypothetical protein